MFNPLTMTLVLSFTICSKFQLTITSIPFITAMDIWSASLLYFSGMMPSLIYLSASSTVSMSIFSIRGLVSLKSFSNCDLLGSGALLKIDMETVELAERYIKEGIIPEKYRSDALHISIAVINGIEVIVSWNFE